MKVVSIREQEDGSASITYDITSEEEQMFKELARKKHRKYNKEFINKCILKALEEAIKRDSQKKVRKSK